MRILCLADVHIGAIRDTKYVYDTMIDIIDKEVMLETTDAVIILGDYFDRLFKVNEDYVALAINVMSYLVRACKKKNTKIRIVYGTESHDMGQYTLLNYFFSSKSIDMKLITTCEEEELFPGCNVLYLPEEYIADKHEFYKDTLYSGKQYQYIFGHGIIEDGMPPAVAYTRSNNGEKQVPRFRSGELAAAGRLTVFGHYHVMTEMEGNVYYLGSLFRWKFGEEKAKGYGIIKDDEFTFVENTKAYVYKTYEYDKSSHVYDSMDNLAKEIDSIKQENADVSNGTTPGMIRIIFHPSENVDPAFKENLKSMLFNDKQISSLVKEESTQLLEDAASEIDDEYSFILDSSLPITDKIHRYLMKQYEEDLMSLEELVKYINEPLEL